MQRERSSRSAITVSSGRSSSRTSSPSASKPAAISANVPEISSASGFAGASLRSSFAKRKEPVHERLELCLLGVDRLQITRLRLFILCHTVEQALGVGADRRQRAFEVVRHPRNQLRFCCWRLCASNEVFSRAAISSTASQAGLNSSGTDIADRRVEVSFLNPLHAGHQNIQRLLDVRNQVLCQIEIRKAACRQQRQNDRAAINCGQLFSAPSNAASSRRPFHAALPSIAPAAEDTPASKAVPRVRRPEAAALPAIAMGIRIMIRFERARRFRIVMPSHPLGVWNQDTTGLPGC